MVHVFYFVVLVPVCHVIPLCLHVILSCVSQFSCVMLSLVYSVHRCVCQSLCIALMLALSLV